MKIVKARIANIMLRKWLAIPPNVELHGIDFNRPEEFNVYLKSDVFDDIKEGENIPEVNIINGKSNYCLSIGKYEFTKIQNI